VFKHGDLLPSFIKEGALADNLIINPISAIIFAASAWVVLAVGILALCIFAVYSIVWKFPRFMLRQIKKLPMFWRKCAMYVDAHLRLSALFGGAIGATAGYLVGSASLGAGIGAFAGSFIWLLSHVTVVRMVPQTS